MIKKNKKIDDFIEDIRKLNEKSVVNYLSNFFSNNFNRWKKPEDRPWDLTPSNLMNLSRFLINYASQDGKELLSIDRIKKMLKDYYNLKDDSSRKLLRSGRIKDNYELSLRQEYVRSFYSVRGDHYYAILIGFFELLKKKSKIDLKVFGLEVEEFLKIPFYMVEYMKNGVYELKYENFSKIFSEENFKKIMDELSITIDKFRENHSRYFLKEYFETTYNPLIKTPVLKIRDEVYIPIVPQFLYHRIIDIILDGYQRESGEKYQQFFNEAVMSLVYTFFNNSKLKGKIKVPFNFTSSDNRWGFIYEENSIEDSLIQIIPLRIQNIYSTTCNVLNIYERLAAVIAPTILELKELLGKRNRNEKRFLPLVVTFQPLYVKNISHLKKSIEKILVDEYEVVSSSIPSYIIMDIMELELTLNHTNIFNSFSSLLGEKKNRRFIKYSFYEFLRRYAGGKFNEKSLSLKRLDSFREVSRRLFKKRVL